MTSKNDSKNKLDLARGERGFVKDLPSGKMARLASRKGQIDLPSLWEGGESCEPEGRRNGYDEVVCTGTIHPSTRSLAQPSLLVALASLPGGERI